MRTNIYIILFEVKIHMFCVWLCDIEICCFFMEFSRDFFVYEVTCTGRHANWTDSGSVWQVRKSLADYCHFAFPIKLFKCRRSGLLYIYTGFVHILCLIRETGPITCPNHNQVQCFHKLCYIITIRDIMSLQVCLKVLIYGQGCYINNEDVIIFTASFLCSW